jgi:SagB-type dehydrogenase family enzyme
VTLVGPGAPVHRYHDGTKHQFHRFAQSLGYLDWATQPDPFRRFPGAANLSLYPAAAAPPGDYAPARVAYEDLRISDAVVPAPLTAASLGDLLRHALGISAWKQFSRSRWSLRTNPSSGNLHPTEAYVVAGPIPGLAEKAGVFHYAPERHALELRCVFAPDGWRSACRDPSRTFLIVLSSIHWRESWKYGERAFRYCQHDLGHAIAALRLAAALIGWRIRLQPDWSHRAMGTLIGLDRGSDYVEAEREEPACLLSATSHAPAERQDDVSLALVDTVRAGSWSGRANQLSQSHVDWTFIDEIARATEDPGRVVEEPAARRIVTAHPDVFGSTWRPARALDARAVILKRRSALAFDGQSSIDLLTFTGMLSCVMPGPHPPWDVLWWTPRIHLAIFVHRVDRLEAGLYLLPRDVAVIDPMKAAFGRDFLWQRASDVLPLFCLARGDCRRLAARLSCDQDIASDGFFSLAMIAEFDGSLAAFGPSFYRCLFWESGFVGQLLYLEAEAAGARATGIGCFYDDPVHDVLGLEGHAFQSLYHFAVGVPVDDERLTTEPGYPWER